MDLSSYKIAIFSFLLFWIGSSETVDASNGKGILFGSRDGITHISLNGSDLSTLQTNTLTGVRPIFLALHHQTETVYFSNQNWMHISINKIKLDGTEEAVVLPLDHDTAPEGVAIDWIAQNLYWVTPRKHKISVSRLDGSSPVDILTDLDVPRAIALDPSHIFWTDWGKRPAIMRALLDGSEPEAIVEDDLGYPNGLALDLAEGKLYWGDAYMDRIEVCNLDGSDRRALITADVSHVFGLAVLDESIYWSDWGKRSIERANKLTGEDRETIFHSPHHQIMGLQAADEDAVFEGTNICAKDNGGCSHLCLFRPSPLRHKCACPEGMTLQSDSEGYGGNCQLVTTTAGFETTTGFETTGFETTGLDDDSTTDESFETTTGFDTTGFDTTGFDTTGFDTTGFDTTGFDTTGFDTTGFDTTGFDTTGFETTGFETTGFDTTGFDTTGFDTTGFDTTGSDTSAFDTTGFDTTGFDTTGFETTGFDTTGFDTTGFDTTGFDTTGFDTTGFDTTGFDTAGFETTGFDTTGFETTGFETTGFETTGFDTTGFDTTGFDTTGFDTTGFETTGFETTGFDTTGFDTTGFDTTGFDTTGFETTGFETTGFETTGFDTTGFDDSTTDGSFETTPPFETTGIYDSTTDGSFQTTTDPETTTYPPQPRESSTIEMTPMTSTVPKTTEKPCPVCDQPLTKDSALDYYCQDDGLIVLTASAKGYHFLGDTEFGTLMQKRIFRGDRRKLKRNRIDAVLDVDSRCYCSNVFGPRRRKYLFMGKMEGTNKLVVNYAVQANGPEFRQFVASLKNKNVCTWSKLQALFSNFGKLSFGN